MIVHTHGTKAHVICTAQRKMSVFFYFYDVNMSTKSETDSEFSYVSHGEVLEFG